MHARTGRGRTCASCSTSSARRSSSSASCSRPAPTSCRRTSSPSCAASRTTCARSRSRRSARSSRRSSACRSSRLFVEFEERPIAAASIGQVHRAVLPNGDQVAVKVQRPDAPRQIEADLALLYQAARVIKERVRALDFIDAHAARRRVRAQIRQELDYAREGRNAETFRRNFRNDERVHVPKVYWTYSRRPRPDPGVHRRRAARRPADRDAARAPSPGRAPDERRLDGDDLP